MADFNYNKLRMFFLEYPTNLEYTGKNDVDLIVALNILFDETGRIYDNDSYKMKTDKKFVGLTFDNEGYVENIIYEILKMFPLDTFNNDENNSDLMPTATELGYVEQGENASPLKKGDKIEVNGTPEFRSNKDGKEYAIIPTTRGNRYTFGSAIIGNLRSTAEKSVGQLIARALNDKKTLTLFVTSHPANNESGREVLGLSIFEQKRSS